MQAIRAPRLLTGEEGGDGQEASRHGGIVGKVKVTHHPLVEPAFWQRSSQLIVADLQFLQHMQSKPFAPHFLHLSTAFRKAFDKLVLKQTG